MELLKELKRADDSTFKVLKAGNYYLSIQGSSFHYSYPRVDTIPNNYKELELAIFNKNGWFDISKSSVLRDFKRFEELMTYSDGEYTGIQVFAYVPIEILNDLYKYLKNK